MSTYPESTICVSCRSLCPRPLAQQVERIAAAGVKRIILREKDLSPEEYLSLAAEVLEQCRRFDTELIIHNFPEAARALGVTKLHIPMNRLTEELCREFEITGTSVHSREEAVRAEKLGVSYITAGHIFATDCKKGLAPRGLDFLREVCGSVSIPVYAIGGITEDNIGSVISAGAKGACIMSGLMKV